MNSHRIVKITIYLSIFIFLIMSPFLSMAQPSEKSEKLVSIDFKDVDIDVFIKFISELTGKNFVIDKKVKGKVTIISPSKISIAEAYKVFESVLEVHGYAAVKAGKVIKIISLPDARSKNVETRLSKRASSPEDKIVTQILRLNFADSNEIKRLFAPLIAKSSVILAYPPTNTIIITDMYSNILRLIRILNVIDVEGVGKEISVIPLEFANATKLVKLLSAVFKTKVRTKKGAPDMTTKFVADERTNIIVILASEDETVRVKKLIALLDRKVQRGDEKIRVYYLENATAEELAKVLQSLTKKQSHSSKAQAPIVSEDVKITADKATNSLIIMADKDDYQIIEEIIKKLDVPRSMVYIECLIMEVNVNKEFHLGVEWSAGEKIDFGNKEGGVGGGFGGSTNYSNMSGLIGRQIANISTLPSGFSLGVFAETLKIGDLLFPSLGAMIQAYKEDKDVHILSTPQILTTDNEEAKITVGKNIPFKTKTGTTSSDETYETYEYKDVGITLKITPQISKDRMVRLNISQEVTKLESTVDYRPTTLKRTIDTTVIVKDKNTVVIGGLIDDSFSITEYKVPCLGEIPLLKFLFSSESTSRDKTNLFVFLTPHVIKNSEEAKIIHDEKKKHIEQLEQHSIKMYK